MKSIRRGLWDGEVEKDTRGRFACGICRESLTVPESAVSDESADESIETDGGVRSCPECGRSWKSRQTPRWRTTGG
ncbi:hypothetical protein [Halorussus ruber]|uniref:hypothetical protein n=1 Tax=Halorussus ruber TaxID=1126238 RepID=UPI0010921384|nr:hypothetical protein [Halorussus ruber]